MDGREAKETYYQSIKKECGLLFCLFACLLFFDCMIMNVFVFLVIRRYTLSEVLTFQKLC